MTKNYAPINRDDFWITSDLHLGHRLVSEKVRGFDSIPEHDRAVVEGIISTVPSGSTLICLGDISVRKDQYALDTLMDLKTSLDLQLILTPGNHDLIHPMNPLNKVLGAQGMYDEVFDLITMGFTLNHARNKVLFTHYPSIVDEFVRDKALPYIPRQNDSVVVHGHTHSATAVRPNNVNVNLESTDMLPMHSSALWPLVDEAATMRVDPGHGSDKGGK